MLPESPTRNFCISGPISILPETARSTGPQWTHNGSTGDPRVTTSGKNKIIVGRGVTAYCLMNIYFCTPFQKGFQEINSIQSHKFLKYQPHGFSILQYVYWSFLIAGQVSSRFLAYRVSHNFLGGGHRDNARYSYHVLYIKLKGF